MLKFMTLYIFIVPFVLKVIFSEYNILQELFVQISSLQCIYKTYYMAFITKSLIYGLFQPYEQLINLFFLSYY